MEFVVEVYKNSTHWNYHQTFRHITILTNKKGNILSFGVNGHKTHPLTRIHGYRNESIHSELDAYLKIRHFEFEFNLINFRLNKKLELRNSKPCECCMNWISSSKVLDIFYSTDKGFEQWNY